jgi:C4-dicarboxylate transporter
VLQAVVIGVVVTALVAKLSPSQVVKEFFDGMGEAYASVIGTIIGGLGRSMSPVAAATAIAAGYAGVSVFDIAKRTASPAIVSAVVVVVILGFAA